MDTQENKSLREMLHKEYSVFVKNMKDFMKEQTLTTDWENAINGLNLNLCIQSSETDNSDILLTDADRVKPFVVDEDGVVHCLDSEKDDIKQRALSLYNMYDVETVAVNNMKYGNDDDDVTSHNIYWIISYEKGFNKSQRFFAKVVLKVVEKSISDLSTIRDAQNTEFWKNRVDKINFDLMDWYIKEIFNTKMIPDVKILTQIAFQNYENRVNKSTLLFLNKEEFEYLKNKGEGLLYFNAINEMQGKDKSAKVIKTVRKMLEACGPKNGHCCYLIAQNEMPYQLLGIVTDEYFAANIAEKCKYWSVDFLGNGDWRLSASNDILFTYSKGSFWANSQQLVESLETKVQKLHTVKNKAVFVNILKRLREQNHGALMIVAEDAKRETEILCEKFKKGTSVGKIDLAIESNLRLLDGIASVDGALLVDFEGVCYGFSVILDGDAKVEGDVGRGSRYNSSVNYIAGKERYAIIVSEDKENGIEIEYGKDLVVLERN